MGLIESAGGRIGKDIDQTLHPAYGLQLFAILEPLSDGGRIDRDTFIKALPEELPEDAVGGHIKVVTIHPIGNAASDDGKRLDCHHGKKAFLDGNGLGGRTHHRRRGGSGRCAEIEIGCRCITHGCARYGNASVPCKQGKSSAWAQKEDRTGAETHFFSQ